MREETDFKPKPMVEIGGKPVLWHIMKGFSSQGFNEFVVLAGYRANVIKEYLLHLRAYSNDFSISTDHLSQPEFLGKADDTWRVSILDTGATSQTAQRLLKAREVIGGERFICVYGDGLASINVANLLKSHSDSGKLASLTVTRPANRFGVVEVDANSSVVKFAEKPEMSDYINIGYFVFETEIFDFVLDKNESIEDGLLPRLAAGSELNAYVHRGFWEPMDTYREYQRLNSMWDSGNRPWEEISD